VVTSRRPELQKLGFNWPHDAAYRAVDLAIKDARIELELELELILELIILSR
jgi:hypothetical protein